jgi:hypothetical protein
MRMCASKEIPIDSIYPSFDREYDARACGISKKGHAVASKTKIFNESADREQPTRRLGKRDAIRHLIHGAIRLIMKMEDPFAVHLLVQSADKLLIDVAEKMNTRLDWDWELYVKEEYHSVFFERYRGTYNFLKHANKDFDEDAPVNDIMMLNVMGLLICVVNYVNLYNVKSNHHIRLYIGFVRVLMPSIMIPDHLQESNFSMDNLSQMTPKEFFGMSDLLPNLAEETSMDLEEILEFYMTPFQELRQTRAW